MSAISIQNLTKHFPGITAVNNLSLQVKWGEILALLGPNGAGKTTTLNILSTLTRPSQGTVTVGGYDILQDPAKVRALIGVCPQEPAYFGFLTGRENIALFGQMYDLPPDLLRERIDDLVTRIGMMDHVDRRAREYSGGMIRRISTLMALIHDPKIALLDEPTVAMDPVSRRAVWDFIIALKSQGKAIILTTHYMEEAEALADRVAIVNEGHLIALGTPQELMQEHDVDNLEAVFIKLTGKQLREVF